MSIEYKGDSTTTTTLKLDYSSNIFRFHVVEPGVKYIVIFYFPYNGPKFSQAL